jgi:hypothetical protein
MQQSNGGSDGREVVGSYKPLEEGDQELVPPNHSAAFDRALDRALRAADLEPGTYNAAIRHAIGITVTNPPGITEYRIILSIE